MKLLLDANVLLWALYDPERLSSRVAALLQDQSNTLLVSHATLWELLAKVGRGRLLMAGKSVSNVLRRINELDIIFVSIATDHIVAASTLPHRHSDPFDRMLAAQAMAEDAAILSADGVLGGIWCFGDLEVSGPRCTSSRLDARRSLKAATMNR